MNTEKFINLLEKKQAIQQLETAELKSIVDEFPYFLSARTLYLKGLKNQDSFKYNNELKQTAAYTTDRNILFNFISSDNFNISKEDIHQKISEKISNESEFLVAPDLEIKPTLEKSATKIEEIEKELSVGKPITFSSSENHSFGEWLQLSTKKPIVRTDQEKVLKVVKEEDIIDRFIQTNPKLEPLAKDKKITIPVKSNKQDSSLMTETLAKVYLEQKKYESVIQAYRILSLKYPEKSGYFADQIKKVKILQKNKS
ncbi:MAG: hypothetical protein AB8B78_12245 [Polaribacter sp.]